MSALSHYVPLSRQTARACNVDNTVVPLIGNLLVRAQAISPQTCHKKGTEFLHGVKTGKNVVKNRVKNILSEFGFFEFQFRA